MTNFLAIARRAASLAAAVLGLAGPAAAQERAEADSVATFELSAVEEAPRPTNTTEFRQALDRLYPPLLRDAGVTGTVHVHIRVLEDGRVDPGSVTVINSTHEMFNDPTIRAVRVLRFRPARASGQPVRVWVELPVQWIPPDRPGPAEPAAAQQDQPRRSGAGEGTYELSRVEEMPRPVNIADLRRALDGNYPPLLRDARVTGTVQVRLLVLEDGSVDAESIQITSTSHEQFDDPTIRSVSVLRFRPAKVNGRPVRVWIELPIQWIP